MKTCFRFWCALLAVSCYLICNQSAAQVCTPPDCSDGNPCTADVCSLGVCTHGSANFPPKAWDARFGGSGFDVLMDMKQTSDGGYILGGYSDSNISGDKTQNSQGGDDYWVVKINSSGVKEWDARFGGSDNDFLNTVLQTNDGGYLLGGEAESPLSGDVTQATRGDSDYWVVKINSAGVKEWDFRYGGSSSDDLKSIAKTADGGYLLGGRSGSPISGDKTVASKGSSDFWVVKINSAGVKQWDQVYGGSGNEDLDELKATSDGGYILLGNSDSGISGDKTQASRGMVDFWAVKITSTGVKQWDAGFGGSNYELGLAVEEAADGGYLLGGYTASPVSGDVTQTSRGSNDFWAVKVNSSGVKQWDVRFGGTSVERMETIKRTANGGFLLGGNSSSDISSDVTQASKGSSDFWVVEITDAGVKQWDARYGGSSVEVLFPLFETTDGGYALAGYSQSGISGDRTQDSRGSHDYWIVKLLDNLVCDDDNACTYDYCENNACTNTAIVGCVVDPCEGIVCDDNNLCTTDACADGDCVFTAIVCDDAKSCTDDLCVLGECEYVCNTAPQLVEWQKALGGTADDNGRSVQLTNDGGYIMAGGTLSNNGNVSGNHGGEDFWVVKTDASGSISWQKTFGGTGGEQANAVQQTADGGYIVAGHANSTNGDVTGVHGSYDMWVVKLDASGNLVWQKALGGTGTEEAYSISQTADGGYIVSGLSISNNGDVTGNHGNNDWWVVKLTSTGAITWQKSLGGTGTEGAYFVRQTADGGYIVAGGTSSTNGDVTGAHGGGDCWIVKLDTAGNLVWQKALGGTASDEAYSVKSTPDGGYIVTGYINSTNGDVTGNHGGTDAWVVKLDATGNITWQKALGGTANDIGFNVNLTTDGNYIITGYAASTNGDVTGNLGSNDAWVMKVSAYGDLIWEKTLGGTGDDQGQGIQEVADGGYIVLGRSSSNNGDVTGNHGSTDFWLAKLIPPCTEICNGVDDDCDGNVDGNTCDGKVFPCTNTLLLTQYVGNAPPTTLYDVVVDNTVTFSPLLVYGYEINSIAFNPFDHFIYGVEQNTNTIIRMFNDGTSQDLGRPAGLSSSVNAYTGGGFDLNGNYVISGGNVGNEIVTLGISGNTVTVLNQVNKFYNPATTGTSNLADIAFHPTTGRCYGFDFNTNKLVKVNPLTGEVNLVSTSAFANTFVGALFFRSNGQLYGYGQSNLYSINTTTGVLTVVTSGPTADSRDGCSCPFTVEMTKTASPSSVCPGDTVTYTIGINNQIQDTLTKIAFGDALNSGMTVVGLPNNLFGGTIPSGSGIGTSSLKINGMSLLPNTSTFTFKVLVPANYQGSSPIANQALLTGLPEIYGDTVVSDDPGTTPFNDSTDVTIRTDCDQEDCSTIVCNDQNPCTTDACSAVGLTNGSFEAPVVSGNAQLFTAPSSAITGWQVTAGSVDIIKNTLYAASDGAQSIDLVGVALATIQQTFTTTPGLSYTLSFDYSNNPQQSQTNSARVQVIGSSTLRSDTVTHAATTIANMAYTHYSKSFIANSSQTIVRFNALTSSNNGGVQLDNVKITGGVCTYTPVVCADVNVCTSDACVNGICEFTPVDCNDQLPCTDDACTAATLTNGGFELPVAQTFLTFTGPSSGITGWQVTAGTVDIVRSTYPPFQGGQSIDLVGTSLGTVEQTFPTTVGLTYQISFYYSNNPTAIGTGSITARVQIIGSSTLFDDTLAHTGATAANMNYQQVTASFIANSSQTTIRFNQLTTFFSAAGIVIDDVTITGGVCQFTANPVVASILPATAAICTGDSIVLSASATGGSGNYTFAWSTGRTTASILAKPTSTTTYTVTVTDSRGCAGNATRIVTVNALPTVAIAPATVALCPGQSVTLTASGGGTYAWSTGATGAVVNFNPIVTTTYTVTVTSTQGCKATASRVVTLNPMPQAVISPATVAVCSGQSATLTASGGGTYAWSTGGTTATITVSPAVNITYTVTVTDANGCQATASRAVTVSQTATATINPATVAICVGQSASLTASGGGTYAWSTGATSDIITVNPTSTTTYTVTVTSGQNCVATASRVVTVNPLPQALITPATVAVCPGQSTTLTASGGVSYAWSTGATTAIVIVSPSVNTTYTVTVTDANGCQATASSGVTMNTAQNISISPDNVSVCLGQSATLTATGGGTYAWSTGATTAVITVTPTSTTTYTVTVTSDQGCVGSASKVVTVNPLPQAAIAPATVAICPGQTATLTASGGGTYAWSTGATTAVITVSPTITTTYTVTVTSGQNCNATSTRVVTVNQTPTADIAPATVAICVGQSASLTASGGGTYAWSTGATTSIITVSPTVTTTYTVTVTSGQNCVATASRAVTVNPLPLPAIAPATVSVCAGQSATLTASGGTSYAWSTGATTAIITISPIINTTYTVTVTNDQNCSAPTSRVVTISGCDDANACTQDLCGTTGCTHPAVDCNDDNACTADACLPPTIGCVNSTIICNDQSACTVDSCNTRSGCFFTTISCNDNDACTEDGCNQQTGCTHSATNCNDQNACTTDACDILNGCTHNSVACDDSNACTNDICSVQTGCKYTVISCNDQNPCTTDGCNTARGCVHGTTPCSDQNACTTDGCDPQIPTGCTHVTVNCADSNPCTQDSCTAQQGCIYFPTDCNDNDPCTNDGCDPQTLTGCTNTPVFCADTDLCTTDKCVEGLCIHLPVVCDDVEPCTDDACVAGECQFTEIVCDDQNLCTNDFCVLGSCINEQVTCNDSNACTQDFCESNECHNLDIEGCCLSNEECDDRDVCSSDICNGFRCYHTVGMCCNDNDACTYDFCLQGVCVATPKFCDDGSLCTGNFCVEGVCSYPQIDCSDDAVCTFDSCIGAGNCTHTNIDCNDQDACTTDFCDTTGICQHLPVPCDDQNLCTVDNCVQGECFATPVTCNDQNLCTDDFCVEGECVYLTVDCGDGDICTMDSCDDGDCLHPAVNCDDSDACTLDSCGQFGCFYTGINCDDNELCTIDGCESDECTHTQQQCDDGNACTYNVCMDGLCQYPAIVCDDQIECTVDRCENGICQTTPGQISVEIQKMDMSCGCANANQLCLLDFAGLPAGTILGEQYASYGIHISALANSPGKNKAIVFNSFATGTPDPDLEVDTGNLMVIARDLVDTNPADGLVDKPNDNSTGGTITLLFDFPRAIESFTFVDEEDPGTFAFAYDAQDNLIAFVAVPPAGDGSIQLIPFATNGVRKLVFSIDGSGAVTDIIFADCCCDGSATATATGGSVPYTFQWSNGGSGSGISELCPDEYCVTVTDANGCFAISCTEIVQGGNRCDDGDSCTTDACGDNACIHTPIPGCEPQQPCIAEITGYTLMYEGTLGEIGPLTDGMVIDRDEFCRINIRADYCGTEIGSVQFMLNGNQFRIEQDVPYALAGDNPTGNYHVWTPAPNSYTLTAIPYSGPSATGTPGVSLTVHFTVVDNTPQDNVNCTEPPFVDCNGDVNGLAFMDACGVCAWGNTGIIPNSQCACDGEVNITVEPLPVFCQGGAVLLKAVNAGATSFTWSTGETTMQIEGLPNTVYSVTTTDANNCVAADTQTTPPASALLATYVILTDQGVTLDKDKVVTGGVGVTAVGGTIILNNGTQVTTPNTFVRATNIALNGGSTATTQIFSAVNIAPPAFESNGTSGGNDVLVSVGSSITLNNAFYGRIQIDSNSTVAFTQAQIDIDTLVTDRNVTIRFESGCVKMRIRNYLTLGVNNAFNADTTAEVKMFVEGNVTIGGRSMVIADIQTLSSLNTGAGVANDYTTMIGSFIANDVFGGQFTSWQWNPSCRCSSTGGPRGDEKMSGTPEPTVVLDNKVLLRTFPNPFSERLNVEFSVPQDSKVKLDIFSSNGKKIATLYDGQVKAAELRKVEYIPSTQARGLVLYRLQTNEGVYYGKAVMIK